MEREMEPENASPEEGVQKKKRFRWGCFLLVTVIFLLLLLLLALLFWPVDKKPGPKKEAEPENSLSIGGARFEIMSAEIIGPAATVGPGETNYFRLLITARITNLTEVNQALDIYLMMVKQAQSVGQSLPSVRGTQSFYDREGVESPWDQPLRPGQSQVVRSIFVIRKPFAGLQLYVKKGFGRNSRDYTSVSMPEIFVPEKRKRSTTTTDPNYVRDAGDVMHLDRREDLKRHSR